MVLSRFCFGVQGLSVNRKSLAKESPASDILVPSVGLMDPKCFCSGTRPNMPMETGLVGSPRDLS